MHDTEAPTMSQAEQDAAAWRSTAGRYLSALDVAERQRDEVGIQLVAAQAEIARMRAVVDAARDYVDCDAVDDGGIRRALVDALRSYDAVPGDALAPVVKEYEHHVVALADLNTGKWRKMRVFHVLDEARSYFDELMAELEAAPQPGVFVKISGTLAPPVPTSPAGASAPASGSTPAASSATSSSSEAVGNPSAPRGTCDRITAALEASGIDTDNVKGVE